jgi:hypothetical protein
MKTMYSIIKSVIIIKHRANQILKNYANTNSEHIPIFITP